MILLYTQTIKLALKVLVGEGAVFLKNPTDHLTPYKTRPLPWLTQIVSQITEGVEWQGEFKCEGISNLADFRAFIAEFDAMEPVPARFILINGAVPRLFPTSFANPTS
jgi:hypothetical protein